MIMAALFRRYPGCCVSSSIVPRSFARSRPASAGVLVGGVNPAAAGEGAFRVEGDLNRLDQQLRVMKETAEECVGHLVWAVLSRWEWAARMARG